MVALQQHDTLISADVSAGAATTIDFLSPSGPKLSSTNSFTSRPRSPTRPTTTISASVKRVIIPNSVLLPTPDPANRPIRCPRPTVSNPFIARTPTSNGSEIPERAIGLSGSPRIGAVSDRISGILSKGTPAPSIILPKRSAPSCTWSLLPTRVTFAPGLKPFTESSAASISLSPSNPTTSAPTNRELPDAIRHREPMPALRPPTSSRAPESRISLPVASTFTSSRLDENPENLSATRVN